MRTLGKKFWMLSCLVVLTIMAPITATPLIDSCPRLIMEVDSAWDGSYLGVREYKYDEQGREVEILDSSSLWGSSLMKAIYDAEGNVVESRNISNGTLNHTVLYLYDNDGKKILIVWHDSTKAVTSWATISYENDGKKEVTNRYTADSIFTVQYVSVLDQWGNTISSMTISYVDIMADGVKRALPEDVNVYSKGIQVQMFSSKYDPTGKRRLFSYIHFNNSMEYQSTTEYFYNKQGKLTEARRFWGPRKTDVTKYEYGKHGRKTRKVRMPFDVEGGTAATTSYYYRDEKCNSE